MSGRTFIIGDIHGDLDHLEQLLERLPTLDAGDTLVFLGDYVDRGPSSRQVVARIRALPQQTAARVIPLCGNHEQAWLRTIDQRDQGGWPDFVMVPGNGCRATLRSYLGAKEPSLGTPELANELEALLTGAFFPDEEVAWLRTLRHWHEDDLAIYVHGALIREGESWLHPAQTPHTEALLWSREHAFFEGYIGKLVVCGHTQVRTLPQERSLYTPDDPLDMWVGPHVMVLDTGCGRAGGFLTALELPALRVYESVVRGA
jgi:predicted MPP superfamily phosphohydrolase